MSLCYKMARRLCLLVVVLFLFQIGASLAVEKDTPQGEKFSGVDFKDGLLKVSVEKQSFKEVMDKVAKKAGIKILIDNPVDEDLTTSFDYLPLEDGLRRLLRGKNYAFEFQSGEGDVSKRSSSLMKVFAFPKLEGLGKDVLPDNALQTVTMNEIQNQVREKMDGVLALQNFSQNDVDLRKRISGAMEKTKEINEIMQGFPHDKEVIMEKIKKAMEKIKKASEGIQVERGGGDDTK